MPEQSMILRGRVAAAFLGAYLYVKAHDEHGIVSIVQPLNDDGEESYAPIAYLADTDAEPGRVLEHAQNARLTSAGLDEAIIPLDEPVALLRIEPLDRSGSHVAVSSRDGESGACRPAMFRTQGKDGVGTNAGRSYGAFFTS